MVSVQAKVELSGPFFKRDPGKTLRQNVTAMHDALADEMEKLARAQIAARAGAMPFWTAHTHDHVMGYTRSPVTGRRWVVWSAVGIPTTGMDRAQAIRTKAAAASIERRFHPFRNIKSAVYRSRAVVSANLTKGIE